jgi:hypothetical protein
VQFFQKHPQTAYYIGSVILVLLIIWAIIYMVANSTPKKEEH